MNTIKKVRIGNRLIGEGEPCFIIAEAGINHNGDVKLAKRLIDVAKKAEVDAVKFQTFRAEEMVTRNAEKATYQKESTGTEVSQLDMIKKLQLSGKDFQELFAYAKLKGIIFLSSPFDKGSVDLLDQLGVPAFKIPSGEITNFGLLRHIARKRKPVIISTGMSKHREIREALEVIRKEGVVEIILLHCVSCYPARIEDMNLRVMGTLQRVFKLPVGLSDHTLGTTIPIAAAALGASVIEKHFTLHKEMAGPDHKASLEPEELKQMAKAVRQVEIAIGDGKRRLTAEEERIKKVVRRSIVARADIHKGTIIIEEMLDIKRPGTGIEPKYIESVVGNVAKTTIKRDEVITRSKLRD